MQRIRFTSEPGAGAVRVEDLPSGRIQFRPAEPRRAEPADWRQPIGEDVSSYVEDGLRAATEAGEAAGALDFDTLEAEFEENGRLSEESYALLAAAGLPRRIVDRYIEGQKAASDRLMQEVYDIAGGEQRFRAAQIWAQSNLSAEELQAFDEAVNASPERARFAVHGLCAAHQHATGAPPQLTRGEALSRGEGAFSSAQDVANAIRDPRYKTDPAYRAQVAARLAKSRVF